MSAFLTAVRGWAPRLLRLAMAFLAFAFAVSASVAAVAAARHGPRAGAAYALAAAVYALAGAGVCLWAARSRKDWRFAVLLTAGVVAIKAALVAMAGSCPQAGDCRFFSEALRYFLAHGMSDASLRELYRSDYDAHVWISRAFPFFYPLARLFPLGFVTIAQVSNIAVSAAHNLLSFWLYRRWLSPRAARLSLALLTLLPLHAWQTLDFTHQFQGALFVVCAVVALVRLVEAARAGRFAWGGVVALAASLLMLRAQGGLDLFLLAGCCLAALLAAVFREGKPAMRRLASGLLVALAVLYFPAARWFSHVTVDRYAGVNLNSHPVSFVARGWNLPRWGEYYGVYEQVDRITPRPQKGATMTGLIVSQMACEPAKTLVALPWVKLAKFFLVGYAANHETQFHAQGFTRLEAAARATRQVFAPLFLLLAALGCWRWASGAGTHAERWLAGLLPLLFAAIYLVAGETSPRYSFHVHFALAMLAGVGLDAIVSRRAPPRGASPPLLRAQDAAASIGAAVALTLVLAAAALALPPVLKRCAGRLFLADMRQSRILIPAGAAAGGETVFERVVPFAPTAPSNGVVASAEASVSPAGGQQFISWFFWPQASAAPWREATLDVLLNGVRVRSTRMGDLSSANWFSLPLPAGADRCSLRLDLRGTVPSPAPPAGGPAFRWGYIRTY